MSNIQTDRNDMLRALAHVLSGIEGVKHVRREDITNDMVSDSEMPTIIITEGRTTYKPKARHGVRRTYDVMSVLTLDIQVRSVHKAGRIENSASELREGLVDQVISTLLHNPTLNCSLEKGEAARDYCYDAMSGQFQVVPVEVDSGYANALLTHTVWQHVVYDDRPRTLWQTLVSRLRKHTDEDYPTPNEPRDVEIEL
jgi:hypothetical protein